jgi:hypothetical protein
MCNVLFSQPIEREKWKIFWVIFLQRFVYKAIVIIHQRRGYLGEWANADKIDLLILLLNFRIVRRKVKLLEIDALDDRTELTSI